MKKWKILEIISIIIALIAFGLVAYEHFNKLDSFSKKGDILIIISLLVFVLSQFLKNKE